MNTDWKFLAAAAAFTVAYIAAAFVFLDPLRQDIAWAGTDIFVPFASAVIGGLVVLAGVLIQARQTRKSIDDETNRIEDALQTELDILATRLTAAAYFFFDSLDKPYQFWRLKNGAPLPSAIVFPALASQLPRLPHRHVTTITLFHAAFEDMR